jgi:hypothetical protein
MDVEDEPDEIPHIDGSLNPSRAAISMVARGEARRVTVHTATPSSVMPAARQLARAAGVRVELIDRAEAGDDLRVEPGPARGA